MNDLSTLEGVEAELAEVKRPEPDTPVWEIIIGFAGIHAAWSLPVAAVLSLIKLAGGFATWDIPLAVALWPVAAALLAVYFVAAISAIMGIGTAIKRLDRRLRRHHHTLRNIAELERELEIR